jgi:hypothetical protein
MICGPTARRPSISASNAGMSAGDGRTIGPKKFASADSTAGAQDATLQERGLSPEVSLNPRRRLQHVQRPTPSRVSSITPRAARRVDDHVARGRRRGLKIRRRRPLSLFARQCDSAVQCTVEKFWKQVRGAGVDLDAIEPCRPGVLGCRGGAPDSSLDVSIVIARGVAVSLNPSCVKARSPGLTADGARAECPQKVRMWNGAGMCELAKIVPPSAWTASITARQPSPVRR